MALPAPVAFEVTEFDLELMRADYFAHSRVPRPWMLGIGVLYVLLGLVDLVEHRTPWWWSWVAGGAIFMIVSTRAGKGFPAALSPTELRFSETGLATDIAFDPRAGRAYSWREIRAIHDIGDAFVLVPKFGKRVVFPKRDFPDGGREAWSFFSAHRVAGRTRLAAVVGP